MIAVLGLLAVLQRRTKVGLAFRAVTSNRPALRLSAYGLVEYLCLAGHLPLESEHWPAV